ncbi:MAG: hypothetical protein E7548_05835 [Ruminococcaceae bacterium]|nr:hypothetical protein [Oscillospiraceae bacterium]
MKNKILKIISLFCALCLLVCLAGCGKTGAGNESSKDNESELSSSIVSSTESEEQISGGGGAKPRLETAFAVYDGIYPKIEWSRLAEKKDWTAKVVIKDLKGKTVFEEDGIKTNSYTLKKALNNNEEYRLFVYYSNADSSVSGTMAGVPKDGVKIIYQKRSANQSKYYFDGSIGLDTLNNYLNRVSTYCQFFQPEESDELVIESIVGIGAKYIQRAACMWSPSRWEYAIEGQIKKRMDKIHALDPEIIFEACIFECVDNRVEQIAIPKETFEAFGVPYENRNFSLEKMMFPDGTYKNKWGTGAHVPDITQLETQMFFYTRACFYIDSGYEAIHLGQANLIGNNDTNNVCWAKVIGMIRAYAKKNARRHYVILDAHYPSQRFAGPDGQMLTDFNAFPMRISVAKGQKDHKPSEKDPQLCVITPGQGDSPYQKGIRGNSPAGWYTNKYPYLAEVDNWGVDTKNLHKASSYIWGYDEITWFSVQPQWYRQKFVEDLTKQIDSFGENGHFALPTKRYIGQVPGISTAACYFASTYGDLNFYKDMWNRLKK